MLPDNNDDTKRLIFIVVFFFLPRRQHVKFLNTHVHTTLNCTANPIQSPHYLSIYRTTPVHYSEGLLGLGPFLHVTVVNTNFVFYGQLTPRAFHLGAPHEFRLVNWLSCSLSTTPIDHSEGPKAALPPP